MKILIASKERADAMEGVLRFVGSKNVEVWVKEHEVTAYLDAFAKVAIPAKIKIIPDKLIGVGAVRKHLVDTHRKEDYIVILDDDVLGIYYRFADKMELVTNGEHFREILQNSYQVALDLGTPLFTYSANQNPNMYTQLDHFAFKGNVPSCHGIIPSLLGDINYDSRFILMSDMDIALQCKYYRRYLFIDKRYNLKFSDKWFNKGGSSTLRTTEMLQQGGRLLKSKYGNAILLQPDKVQHRIIWNF